MIDSYSIGPGPQQNGVPIGWYVYKNGYFFEMHPTAELAERAMIEMDPKARAEAMKSMPEEIPE